MKITVKKGGVMKFFQEVEDNSAVMNKVMGHLVGLPQGKSDEVLIENNGHEILFTTGNVDIEILVRHANGILVKTTKVATPAA